MTMHEDMRTAIILATTQPKVPQFSEYIYKLATCGASILPEGLRAEVGKALAESEDDLATAVKGTGFTLEENHARSGEHVVWIEETVHALAAERRAVRPIEHVALENRNV